ncbi:MAG: anti-sigma factor domain-containing protein [Clostridia bacterium]|nr:anti-sigma factor domain-containing protein [Clostridia bacterium]
MMRGAIAEIRGSKAIMLTEGGEFITLRNKNYSVGQKVNVSKKTYSKFSALAACLLLFFMLGVGIWGYYTPVSYVDIDINPSFRLELNIFDRVINVEPLNEDARNFIKITGSLPGNMEECLEEITVKAKKYGYIHGDNNDIYIHSVSSDNKFSKQLNKYAKKISEKENVHIYPYSEKRETLNMAREHKVSVGRIKLIDEYTKVQGGTIDENIANLTGKTNKEIRIIIAEQSKQETSANEKTDKTKETPADEKNDKAKETPADEKTDKTKEIPADEKTDKTKETPADEKTDKTKETPADEKTDKTKETPADEKTDKTKGNSGNSMPESIPEKSDPPNHNVAKDKDKSQEKTEMKNENAQENSNKEKSNNENSKNHGNKK